MSVLRILSPAPVIRDHYGTLWHDSQHPIGYILGLVVGPLAFSVVVAQFLTINWAAVQFLVVLFGLVFAFSFRAPFQIPNPDETEGEREKAALKQLRRSSMYAVFVSLISLLISAIVAGAFFMGRQNPSLIDSVQMTLPADIIQFGVVVASIALIFLFIHYIATVLVVFRWLYLAFKSGLM
jgi:Ca2+/Na+ antiporter